MNVYDFRLSDGSDVELPALSFEQGAALGNVGLLQGETPHIALADTRTAFAGVLLTAKATGIFEVALSAEYDAAADDEVTFTIEIYADAVPGTPMTLPANYVTASVANSVAVRALASVALFARELVAINPP